VIYLKWDLEEDVLILILKQLLTKLLPSKQPRGVISSEETAIVYFSIL